MTSEHIKELEELYAPGRADRMRENFMTAARQLELALARLRGDETVDELEGVTQLARTTSYELGCYVDYLRAGG